MAVLKLNHCWQLWPCSALRDTHPGAACQKCKDRKPLVSSQSQSYINGLLMISWWWFFAKQHSEVPASLTRLVNDQLMVIDYQQPTMRGRYANNDVLTSRHELIWTNAEQALYARVHSKILCVVFTWIEIFMWCIATGNCICTHVRRFTVYITILSIYRDNI